MTRYDEIRALFESRNQLDRFEAGLKESCGVIMRQTDYDEEKAMTKLVEHDLNVMAVVKEFLGVVEKQEVDNRTTNQKVFGEFRKFLDDASAKFYRERELEQQRQQYQQQQYRQQQLMRIAAAQAEERKRQQEDREQAAMEPIPESSCDSNSGSNSGSSGNSVDDV